MTPLLIGLVVLLWSAVASAHHRPPIVTISTPTTSPTYVTAQPDLVLRGTAQGRHREQVRQVTWHASTGVSGVAIGTTAWQVSLTLTAPTTLLTITATDTRGNTGQDTLTVTLLDTPQPGPITVEWTWTGTQGTAFVVERCTLQQPGCPMAPVATLALVVRLWVDTAVQPDDDYCYRLAVQQANGLGPYSNMLCSP